MVESIFIFELSAIIFVESAVFAVVSEVLDALPEPLQAAKAPIDNTAARECLFRGSCYSEFTFPVGL